MVACSQPDSLARLRLVFVFFQAVLPAWGWLGIAAGPGHASSHPFVVQARQDASTLAPLSMVDGAVSRVPHEPLLFLLLRATLVCYASISMCTLPVTAGLIWLFATSLDWSDLKF